MQIRVLVAGLIIAAAGCSAVRINSHVTSDGANGYLRTYYSSQKSGSGNRTDGTAIEQCKIQGSDVLCKDLNVAHLDDAPLMAQPTVQQAPANPPQPAAPKAAVAPKK